MDKEIQKKKITKEFAIELNKMIKLLIKLKKIDCKNCNEIKFNVGGLIKNKNEREKILSNPNANEYFLDRATAKKLFERLKR